MNNKKGYKRKVSDDLIIRSYIENKSYKKVAGLLKCTEWNVRKVITANREIVPELTEIFANNSNNFSSYYDYKRNKKDDPLYNNNIYINNNNKNKEDRNKKKEKEIYKEKESQVIIADSMVTDISPVSIENGLSAATRTEDNIPVQVLPLPELPDIYNNINNNNIYIPDKDINNNIPNKGIDKYDDKKEIFTTNKKIIDKIDVILDITLKKLSKTLKHQELTARDLSEIISKLISRKIDLDDSKSSDNKAKNTINIFGSPEQAMKLLKEMQKINKNV